MRHSQCGGQGCCLFLEVQRPTRNVCGHPLPFAPHRDDLQSSHREAVLVASVFLGKRLDAEISVTMLRPVLKESAYRTRVSSSDVEARNAFYGHGSEV